MILYSKQSPFRINNKFINPKYYLFIIKFKVSNINNNSFYFIFIIVIYFSSKKEIE